jgi:photosystem II stability/assembly factor-like uncharacterized protein
VATRRRFPKGTVMLAVGTKRGLFLMTSRDRRTWKTEGPSLVGQRVYHATLDQRNGARLYAGANGDFFGSAVRYSDDLGQTWKDPEAGIAFPEGSGLSLKNIWIVEPGRASEPETLYCGVDPAALFVSHDRGQTWAMNQGLEGHPTRQRWQPGLGGLCLHSIVTDPVNPRRMWVAISAVGVMRTDDGGQSWTFCNKGTRADFLPDKYPEFGQCVHRLLGHPANPDILFQQNHCSTYSTANAGETWTEIRNNLPSDFGFPLAIDPHHPETLYTVVETQEGGRTNITDQFTVYRSENAGRRWERLTKGLPKGPNVKLGVLRHGLATDPLKPSGVYVGTNTGQLFASRDRGDSWKMIADFLPPIYSVSVAVL